MKISKNCYIVLEQYTSLQVHVENNMLVSLSEILYLELMNNNHSPRIKQIVK